MTNSVEEWAKAIKAGNVKSFRIDSAIGEIESKADHEERLRRYEPLEIDYNKLKIYFATKNKRGIEHFTSFITTIRGEKYKVYKFYSRTRINRIITRPKLRIKI